MLQRLVLTAFRNYAQAEFAPGPGVNLVFGDNGSGKSSLLEAVYLLGSGRSFRSGRLQRLVNEAAQETVLYAEVKAGDQQHRLGMARTRQQFSGLKLDGVSVRGLSDLARMLPVQVFHPGTVDIVEGPSSGRRRFLDWGLFHVEQSFLGDWRALNTALQQRNRLLRTGRPNAREIAPWDQQVALSSARISQLRSGYLEALRPYLDEVLADIGELPEVSMSLYQGWAEGESLKDLLTADLARDCERGHTGKGAHRAELRLGSHAGPVRDVFSRGQLKTLSYALLLAQLNLLIRGRGGSCLILVDDLASELDQAHSGAVLKALRSLDQQLIITALSADALPELASEDDVKVFHVEHGKLDQVP